MSDDEIKYTDRSFLSRFGAVILSGGIASIPTALFSYQGELKLTPQQVWFVSKILSYKWGSNLPFPSLKRMAEETGVSRQHLHNYQKQLIESGWLKVINRRNAQGGKDSNLFDFSPLFQALEELLQRDHPEGSPDSGTPPQARSNQRAGAATPHVNHSLHTHVNPGGHTYVNSSLHEVEEDQVEPLEVEKLDYSNGKTTVRDSLTQSTSDSEPQRKGRGVTRISEALADAPARFTQARANPEALPIGVPPNLAHYVTAWSRELHDSEHVKSNITQAFRLMQQTGMSETAFMQKLTEARAITKERGNIKKPAKEFGEFGTKNKVPYWFAVLRDLLGLKEKADQPAEYQYGP